MTVSRVEIVRHLLGAATHLFIEDKDPYSVHCLACSAAEHASYLSKQTTGKTFNDHIANTFPEKKLSDIRRLRNQDWRVLKHSSDQKGKPFDTASSLDGFSDEVNDHHLFIVWDDFAKSGEPLPLETQIFQVWYYELYPEKLDPLASNFALTNMFGDIRNTSRNEQKLRLKQAIPKFTTEELLSHEKTDPRELLLSISY